MIQCLRGKIIIDYLMKIFIVNNNKYLVKIDEIEFIGLKSL